MHKFMLGMVLSVATLGTAFAREVDTVNSAVFKRVDGKSILELVYGSGGCHPEQHRPAIQLVHVSTVDDTPRWALERNPNIIRQYQVTMQAKIVEAGDGGDCAMAYSLTVSADINELFRQAAPGLGIDLSARQGHYSLTVLAPKVQGYTHVSAFEN